MLKLSAILTHNVGDVDQGLNYWQVRKDKYDLIYVYFKNVYDIKEFICMYVFIYIELLAGMKALVFMLV